MTHAYIGVDLSKDWLDIFHPGTGHHRIANTPASLAAWIETLEAHALVVFEATSGCDGALMRALSAARHPAHRLNPLHAWHFARSLNLPKTDRVDARMLARMGAERRLQPAPVFDATRAELVELVQRSDQLKRMITQEKNRLGKAVSPRVRADIRAEIKALDARLQRILTAIDTEIGTRPDLAEARRLLQTIPGVGAVASMVLLAAMPELGSLDRRSVAALGGLAPKARESGKWHGRRAIGAGRRQVRRTLFMAALSVIRHRAACRTTIETMQAKNKPGKVIAIAVARRLLIYANAVLRDNTPFQRA